MTDRYVGPGGNDGSDGLSWANRKLTLNGAEDTPVVAGDTVYVGPGTYRELLTIDVAGTSGAVITYIGDVSGENTDSIGGIVRITGSDNDTTATRGQCVIATSGENYRTFRGFRMDTVTTDCISATDVTNWIIEDCVFQGGDGDSVQFNGASQASITIRRCRFANKGQSIFFSHSSTVSDASHLVENCVFTSSINNAMRVDRVGGIAIKNCTWHGPNTGLRIFSALAGGQTITVNNSLFMYIGTALRGTVTGEIIEDYNSFWGCNTDRNNVDTGGNSVDNMVTFEHGVQLDGVIYPHAGGFFPDEWTAMGRIAGTGESVDDFFGVARPTTSAKKSWGAIQLREAERETGTVQTGSAALTLADAGDHQVYVPVTATSTTFEVAARYESEYAGTLPRLIVRQPGQADQVDTMVAAADTWETLSLTFTPNATPPYVVVILRSLNTSVTGDFDTYWDDLDVS